MPGSQIYPRILLSVPSVEYIVDRGHIRSPSSTACWGVACRLGNPTIFNPLGQTKETISEWLKKSPLRLWESKYLMWNMLRRPTGLSWIPGV